MIVSDYGTMFVASRFSVITNVGYSEVTIGCAWSVTVTNGCYSIKTGAALASGIVTTTSVATGTSTGAERISV